MNIEPLDNYKLTLKHDGSLPIATGKSRMEKNWKNKTMTWSALLKRLENPENLTRTPESYAEYMKMPKDDQDRIKDVGGFIGGSLKDGSRKSGNVLERQLVALDADFAPVGLLEDVAMLTDYGYAVYSTHKHCPKKPRYRFLIPLDRPVTPDEYEAISRKLAEEIGIEYFDDTTYQPSRLMYWPSVSLDGEYIFTYEDLPWVKADAVLAKYPDWTNTIYWPESSRAGEQRKSLATKQGDPTEKPGLIGAFCRTYTVEEAMEKFIPDIYVKCNIPKRYTYISGSTSAGLVVYDDEKFVYSNHDSDAISHRLCNAFDLVRIHKFGIQDEDVASDTTTTKLPSFEAMIELARTDAGTKLELAAMKRKEAELDFLDDENWEGELEYDKKGNLVKSLNNTLVILQGDPRLKGIVFNQMADNLEIKEAVPWKHPNKFWRDADDAQLESFLARCHTELPKSKILTAITKVADDRSYHPVREYLDSLPEWDGIPRVDTLLIDYLGAEDCAYVRAVTRKTLCAAVRRVRNPGCKYDTVLVLCGPQGIGKSTLVHNLGGEWFSDSLNLTDIKDKTAAEKLQGYWIVEIGEMAGIGNAGVKTLRSFITTQDDKYRASYGRRVGSHPRQCILIGTTNSEEGYLNDVEGGRRFWPVNTPMIGRKRVWDMNEIEVEQIWAETLCFDAADEPLILSGEVAEEAVKRQKVAMISDPREELVRIFLERLLPKDWYSRSVEQRLSFLSESELPMPEATLQRTFISTQEIWSECFWRDLNKTDRLETYAIKGIMAKMEGWEYTNEKVSVGSDYGRPRGYHLTVKNSGLSSGLSPGQSQE